MTALAIRDENIPSLRRCARSRLRSAGEADDLVQNCLVRALDKLGMVRSEDQLRSRLFAIMHHPCINHWRRAKIRAVVSAEEAAAEIAVPPPQPASTAMRDVVRDRAGLPPEQRQAVLLAAAEGFEYAELAVMLGIPIGTVMSGLGRARDRPRNLVEGSPQPVPRRVK